MYVREKNISGGARQAKRSCIYMYMYMYVQATCEG